MRRVVCRANFPFGAVEGIEQSFPTSNKTDYFCFRQRRWRSTVPRRPRAQPFSPFPILLRGKEGWNVSSFWASGVRRGKRGVRFLGRARTNSALFFERGLWRGSTSFNGTGAVDRPQRNGRPFLVLQSALLFDLNLSYFRPAPAPYPFPK